MERERIPRSVAEKFVYRLSYQMPRHVRWSIGGSWIRRSPMIGDIDVMVVTDSGFFGNFRFPPCFEKSHGDERVVHGTIRSMNGEVIPAQFWACSPAEAGGMSMFITGPKQLNITQRAKAKRKGYTLSQYGLLRDGVLLPLFTEREIYAELGWAWIPPEERT